MENKEDCSFWEELKIAKTKISLGTNNDLFYTGYVLDCTDSGIIIKDKYDKKIFLNFTNIKFCEPFEEVSQSKRKKKEGN